MDPERRARGIAAKRKRREHGITARDDAIQALYTLIMDPSTMTSQGEMPIPAMTKSEAISAVDCIIEAVLERLGLE